MSMGRYINLSLGISCTVKVAWACASHSTAILQVKIGMLLKILIRKFCVSNPSIKFYFLYPKTKQTLCYNCYKFSVFLTQMLVITFKSVRHVLPTSIPDFMLWRESNFDPFGCRWILKFISTWFLMVFPFISKHKGYRNTPHDVTSS